jgi:GAF domain-containing protein
METAGELNGPLAEAMAELATLQRFAGEPAQFWPAFTAAAAKVAAADFGVLLQGQPDGEPHWVKRVQWSAQPGPSSALAPFLEQVTAAAPQILAADRWSQVINPGTGTFLLGVRVNLSRAEDELILGVLVRDFTEEAAANALMRLGLAGQIALTYQFNLAARQARQDVEKLAAVLDVNVPVNEATQFLAAALAFCNGIATRLRCDRASLGWIEGGYVRLRAMSRTEQFDRQMAAAQALEVMMEECADQDEEILWPSSEGATTVARDHEVFAREQKVAHLASLPLRLDGKVVGVLTCERADRPFSLVEVQQLRLAVDQIVRRLDELKAASQWLGARWRKQWRDHVGRWLGPEHTWSKAAGLGIALLLLLLFVIRVHYRVDGNFVMRSDTAEYLSAPFDGYIEQVHVRPGDAVTNGQALLDLNTGELLLQQSAALADLARYQREADKERAANHPAEMMIYEAQARQAEAQLEMVRYRLDHACVRAGFTGVIVEGDLRERIGAPVKQGDALFKVARLDQLYAEADIGERDVQRILGSAHGEMAFVSQPRIKYPVVIKTIEPAAITKKDGNVFLVRLQPVQPATWWRPGMTGLCKIVAERESLFWILTHRTVDFLRMKLWW